MFIPVYLRLDRYYMFPKPDFTQIESTDYKLLIIVVYVTQKQQ